MKFSIVGIICFLCILNLGCSKSVEYSEQFKKETSGKYLYNADDIIKVYYKDDKLYLNWRGAEIEPVVLDKNEFFVADMYNKLKFIEHPTSKERYISIIHEGDDTKTTYDYIKVADNFKTPTQYLKEKKYNEALTGFLKVKKKDSTSKIISEDYLNRMGYQHFRTNDYKTAIEIFKINAELHPKSSNVYDSLADAYLRNGDSLPAYENYKKALKLNDRNERAHNYIRLYSQKRAKEN